MVTPVLSDSSRALGKRMDVVVGRTLDEVQPTAERLLVLLLRHRWTSRLRQAHDADARTGILPTWATRTRPSAVARYRVWSAWSTSVEGPAPRSGAA